MYPGNRIKERTQYSEGPSEFRCENTRACSRRNKEIKKREKKTLFEITLSLSRTTRNLSCPSKVNIRPEKYRL
jgi:hypothetical protein